MPWQHPQPESRTPFIWRAEAMKKNHHMLVKANLHLLSGHQLQNGPCSGATKITKCPFRSSGFPTSLNFVQGWHEICVCVSVSVCLCVHVESILTPKLSRAQAHLEILLCDWLSGRSLVGEALCVWRAYSRCFNHLAKQKPEKALSCSSSPSVQKWGGRWTFWKQKLPDQIQKKQAMVRELRFESYIHINMQKK